MKNWSIGAKLQGSTMGLVLLAGVFTVLFFPAQQRREIESANALRVADLAQTVALGVGIGMESGDLGAVQTSMDYAKADPAVRFVLLESEGDKLSACPEETELTEQVLVADSLMIADALVEARPAHHLDALCSVQHLVVTDLPEQVGHAGVGAVFVFEVAAERRGLEIGVLLHEQRVLVGGMVLEVGVELIAPTRP